MTNNKWFFHFRFLVSIKFLCEGPHLRCTPLHSLKWGLRPPGPHGEGAPPLRPRGFCGAGSPCTHQWAYPAHTRGSFRFTTKGTKDVPGLCPWTP